MGRNMLLFAITKGLIRKHNEVAAGLYSKDEFLEDLLYGIYVLSRILSDDTIASQFKYMSRDILNKETVGFVRAFLLDESNFDFDVYDIKEKLWFLMLYDNVDLGKIGNIKKKLILDDVREWFKDIYMEVKWDESEEFVELLMLMSHIDSLRDLPIGDLKGAIYSILLHRYDGKKPDWRLYWLTGNMKYITDYDIFDRRAWVFWRDYYR